MDAPGTPVLVHVNGAPAALQPGATLLAVLACAGADPARPGIAVAVNDRVVPRAAWAATQLAPGDRVEVLQAVAGG
ncbi:MAG: sulfur carrier protein ThiS [Anaerolineae bacterium]|jgi:sulfur carrier protein